MSKARMKKTQDVQKRGSTADLVFFWGFMVYFYEDLFEQLGPNTQTAWDCLCKTSFATLPKSVRSIGPFWEASPIQ